MKRKPISERTDPLTLEQFLERRILVCIAENAAFRKIAKAEIAQMTEDVGPDFIPPSKYDDWEDMLCMNTEPQ